MYTPLPAITKRKPLAIVLLLLASLTMVFITEDSSVPTFFRGERADWARNPTLNLLWVA